MGLITIKSFTIFEKDQFVKNIAVVGGERRRSGLAGIDDAFIYPLKEEELDRLVLA